MAKTVHQFGRWLVLINDAVIVIQKLITIIGFILVQKTTYMWDGLFQSEKK